MKKPSKNDFKMYQIAKVIGEKKKEKKKKKLGLIHINFGLVHT